MARFGTPPSVLAWLRRFRALDKESVPKTLIISLGVCFACSLVVSGAAVFLAPLHRANIAQEQRHLEIGVQ